MLHFTSIYQLWCKLIWKLTEQSKMLIVYTESINSLGNTQLSPTIYLLVCSKMLKFYLNLFCELLAAKVFFYLTLVNFIALINSSILYSFTCRAMEKWFIQILKLYLESSL